MYVQREKEKETERASETHTSSTATPRKILALPTGPQPARACATLRTSHVGWKYTYT